jgi:hypothetical protein
MGQHSSTPDVRAYLKLHASTTYTKQLLLQSPNPSQTKQL